MKKTLVIMGSHPYSREQFDWSRKDCEVWLFNEAPTAKKGNGEPIYPKCDAFFQLHHEAIWKNPKNWLDPEHYNWLKSGKTPTAYMQKRYKDVPKSVKYPLEKTLALTKNIRMVVFGKEKEFRCFSSTPDFALALVVQMWKEGKRYEKVEIWGTELEMETEYRFQRLGFGFWVGYLAALGVNLELHTALFNFPMYGYEGDVVIPPAVFEQRIKELVKKLGDGKEKYVKETGELLMKVKELLNKDISDEIQDNLNALSKRHENAGILNGKITENKKYLEKAKEMEKKAGVSVFSPGEFDGTRIEYKKQYAILKSEVNILNTRLVILIQKLLSLKDGSKERNIAVDDFGLCFAEMINKNMQLLHLTGGIQENQQYLDSAKLSLKKASH